MEAKFSEIPLLVFTRRPHRVEVILKINGQELSAPHFEHGNVLPHLSSHHPLLASLGNKRLYLRSMTESNFIYMSPFGLHHSPLRHLVLPISQIKKVRLGSQVAQPLHKYSVIVLERQNIFWNSEWRTLWEAQCFANTKCTPFPQMSEGHTHLLRDGNSSTWGENARFKVRLVREGAITDY